MIGRMIVLDRIAGRGAAALMVDGRIEDLLIDPPEGAADGVGAIFRGIVDRPMKGQGGSMLRLPGGHSGFLKQSRGLSPGQPLLVQVTGTAEKGKALPVSTRLLFKGQLAIVTPGAPGINIARSIRDDDLRDSLLEIAHDLMDAAAEDRRFGLILRSAAAHADPDDIAADIARQRDLALAVLADTAGAPELLVDAPDAHMLAWRDWSDPAPDQIVGPAEGAFADHGVLEAVDSLLAARHDLPGGAVLFIEPTRALTAVDVNTGGDTSPAAALKANIAAARALPRLLRLKGLGGQILIDFAPLAKKDRRTLEQVLGAAFRADGGECSLAGWTPLGNFELQRKRDRLPLKESWPR
ncbi:ribonuclease E/G [Brevirhabdus sp.]|uniref:ribonuclease E/G n=1 Tax=Brevirhabdus sp. TaxID=2004514 RepID=UPI0040582D35